MKEKLIKILSLIYYVAMGALGVWAYYLVMNLWFSRKNINNGGDE